jgi:hypothetical protein
VDAQEKMMHSLSIVFGPTGTTWRLLFKSQDAAERAVTSAQSAMEVSNAKLVPSNQFFVLVDDFGQKAVINIDELHGFMHEDLDQTKLAAIEVSLHNAQAQAQAEQRMRSDPNIMAAARNRGVGGPPILAPMGNGFTR